MRCKTLRVWVFSCTNRHSIYRTVSDARCDERHDLWSCGVRPTSSRAPLAPRFAAAGLDLNLRSPTAALRMRDLALAAAVFVMQMRAAPTPDRSVA